MGESGLADIKGDLGFHRPDTERRTEAVQHDTPLLLIDEPKLAQESGNRRRLNAAVSLHLPEPPRGTHPFRPMGDRAGTQNRPGLRMAFRGGSADQFSGNAPSAWMRHGRLPVPVSSCSQNATKGPMRFDRP